MRLVRVTDQEIDFLQRIESYGLVPGVAIAVVSRDAQADFVEIRPRDSTSVSLSFRAASKIQVALEE